MSQLFKRKGKSLMTAVLTELLSVQQQRSYKGSQYLVDGILTHSERTRPSTDRGERINRVVAGLWVKE